MFKYLIIIATIISTLIVNPVVSSAHSSLEGSTPADGETVEYSVDVVTLKFNTSIKEGSTLTITSDTGEQVEVSSVSLQDNLMLGQLSKSLLSGTYTVHYEIVGEDSHVVDGEFSFTVKVDSPEKEDEAAEPKEEADKPSTDQQTDDDANNDTAQENPNEQTTNENELSNTVIAIAAVLIVAGIGLVWWMLQKKGSE
ncbi:copper resistance protein CopC [Alkalihalobacillus sp. AL-G]|uniref:copper resistance CopC family protein n=1 Tax=Alkalihalobacillus sp. AL-G TaxID=2926399 RepID=UPI00272DB711|nr:copper resistance protein CopC [Alkalihalobacillus sp. AL-G]WLD92742.1 copper resistance protein CopC [Alkalihalobacillus sp. AL-G]